MNTGAPPAARAEVTGQASADKPAMAARLDIWHASEGEDMGLRRRIDQEVRLKQERKLLTKLEIRERDATKKTGAGPGEIHTRRPHGELGSLAPGPHMKQ
jgi:hypothetical protein